MRRRNRRRIGARFDSFSRSFLPSARSTAFSTRGEIRSRLAGTSAVALRYFVSRLAPPAGGAVLIPSVAQRGLRAREDSNL
jgi:hypothetical protein